MYFISWKHVMWQFLKERNAWKDVVSSIYNWKRQRDTENDLVLTYNWRPREMWPVIFPRKQDVFIRLADSHMTSWWAVAFVHLFRFRWKCLVMWYFFCWFNLQMHRLLLYQALHTFFNIVLFDPHMHMKHKSWRDDSAIKIACCSLQRTQAWFPIPAWHLTTSC